MTRARTVTPTPVPHFVLLPHPTTPQATAAVFALSVALEATPARWQLRYRIDGPVPTLRIRPRANAPMRRDGLWRHTCFELFHGQPQTTAYEEFNFSPSGDWACYAFTNERLRAEPPREIAPPAVTSECRASALIVAVDIAAPTNGAPSRIGLTAVLEDDMGHLSYWALAHPKPQPDFHARAGWAPFPATAAATRQFTP